jgi:RNA polymerase sigma-70 factor (ECF subfamily)
MTASRSLPQTVPSDAELVLRTRQGDHEAFGTLMARYRQRLGRYAWYALGSRDDAEDALQDTFVRAYRAMDQCTHPERVGAWLFRILINRCRSRQARKSLVVWSRDGEAAYERASVEPASESAAWREEIEHALRQLPADQREAFLLKHVEELSYDEMHELTGASHSALKMRVKRACGRLRLLLEDARA